MKLMKGAEILEKMVISPRGRFAIRERALPVERVTSRQSYVSWESWPRRGYAAPRQGRDLEAATVDNARHLQALLEKEEVRGTVARSGEGRSTKRSTGERREGEGEGRSASLAS